MNVAQTKSPDSQMVALRRASMEEIRDNSPAAESLYRQLLGRTDMDALSLAVASNNLAYLLALEGQGNEALSLVSTALDELGPIDDVLDTRAVVYLAKNEPQKAKQDLQQVISGGSQSPEVFFHLAQVESELGNASGAREALQRAIELGLSVDRVKPAERRRLRQLAQKLGVDLTSEQAMRPDQRGVTR